MRILLVHMGFPGQYKNIVSTLLRQNHELHVISKGSKLAYIPPGVGFYPYTIKRRNATDIHPLCIELESKIIRGEAVAKKALELKVQGFTPDLIMGHPGWGEMLFLKDIWVDTPQLHYVEFFHGVPGTDNDFKDGNNKSLDWKDKASARMKNSHHLNGLNTMTAGVTPTHFQHSLLPEWAQHRTHIIHDGIDTKSLHPDPSKSLKIESNRGDRTVTIKQGDPIVTFINRTFEPYRGIHIFMNALVDIQKKHESAQVLLIGEDSPKVSYGKKRNDSIGWLSAIKTQLGERLDWNRIHPLGVVNHKTLKSIYQISAVHVYLTYPFVLSWSMLEAMSCECLVIGSATSPVQEVIQHGRNGLLVPFSDSSALSESIIQALNKPAHFMAIKKAARKTITDRYELQNCLRQHTSLIEKVCSIAA